MGTTYFLFIWSASIVLSLIIGLAAISWTLRSSREIDQDRVRSLPLRIGTPATPQTSEPHKQRKTSA